MSLTYIPVDALLPSMGKKFDEGKPEMWLLPKKALIKLAKVLSFGKEKYGAHNWRNGIAFSRLLSAALRHIFAYLDGESTDPETGYSHLAHAAVNLLFLLEQEETRPDLDDRYNPKSGV